MANSEVDVIHLNPYFPWNVCLCFFKLQYQINIMSIWVLLGKIKPPPQQALKSQLSEGILKS